MVMAAVVAGGLGAGDAINGTCVWVAWWARASGAPSINPSDGRCEAVIRLSACACAYACALG